MDVPWVGVGAVLLACFIYTQAKRAGMKKWKATALAIVGAYLGGVAIVLVAVMLS
jgi:hypothetical protein